MTICWMEINVNLVSVNIMPVAPICVISKDSKQHGRRKPETECAVQLTPNRHGGSVQQQQFASSAEELNFRFQITRSNVNSSAPQPSPRFSLPSQDFNPTQNYSFQRTGKRRPQKQSVSINDCI